MRLHIFNPEHDIALAADMERFTAPHAGRQMRASLGFLPAFWADHDDLVLVDDVEAAAEAVRHMKAFARDVRFVSTADLSHIDASKIEAVEPWGWDKTLCFQLTKANMALQRLLPDADRLAHIRQISSRQFAAEHLLPVLIAMDSRLIGKSRYCSSTEEVDRLLRDNGRSVIKSPWSCSGRGVRYVGAELDEHGRGWLRNVMAQQGGVTVEPLYQKVCDFGMEFFVDGLTSGKTTVRYCGLSLFDTTGGAYSGSILATERDKRDMLARNVDLQLLDKVTEAVTDLLATTLSGVYSGPLGLDMMAVANTDNPSDGLLLHPCVELNLRRTMGHVALALSPDEFGPRRLMRISYSSGKYKMRIMTTGENLLNTCMV